jgi:protein tyrosine/serine phosphatase
MPLPGYLRWTFGIGLAVMLTVVPFAYYRSTYTTEKRLRVVTPGKVYRSGQMTVEGFTEAVRRLGIRTILNLQDEYPDPDIQESYSSLQTTSESELCRRLGVRYVYISPDLIPRKLIPSQRPEAIDQFLALMDDPKTYPILIHCRAGLHRTGLMVSIYRMEYEGWTRPDALAELKENGFGEWPCTAANDYITQYFLTFQPGLRIEVVNAEQ